MLFSYQLPFKFDPESLKTDLAQVRPEDWRLHFNRTYYAGEWRALALRSTTGEVKQIYRSPDDAREAVATAVLARCAYFQEVLNTFQCPIPNARLMSLTPGSQIREHEDHRMGFEYGLIRIHIPIVTDERVEFLVGRQRLLMQEGEAWYIDFGQPHSVNNLSDADRVHLVIDCTVNDWLRAWFPAGQVPNELSEVLY